VTIAAPLRSSAPPASAAVRAAAAAPASARRGWLLLAVVSAVGALDQASKAWAWRELPLVHINSGGGLLFGDRAGTVYRDGRLGTAIDLAGVALVALVAAVLLRFRWPRLPFLGAALVLGGWASNLADRLGLHNVTAPGSARGVVDFLRWGGRLWNVADVVMIAGVLLGAAGAVQLLRTRAAPSG